jgi:ankyrin repeat protein
MYAVSNNHLEATKTLISLGADVNKTMNNMNPSDLADAGGYRAISTAYNRALKNGNKEILDVLVKAGAKP